MNAAEFERLIPRLESAKRGKDLKLTDAERAALTDEQAPTVAAVIQSKRMAL